MNAKEYENYLKANEMKVDKEYKDYALHNIKCRACCDSGFIWIMLRENQLSLWMFCDCEKGNITKQSSIFKLPQYNYKHTDFLSIKSFPLAAFIPRTNIIHAIAQAEERSKAFKNDLKLSEKYWLENKIDCDN